MLEVNSLRMIEEGRNMWSISGLYVKVYVLIFVHLFVLSIKLFIMHRYEYH